MGANSVGIFRLTPAYCLFNKIAILKQNGSEIVFIMQDFSNEFLKKKIEKAYINYINEIQKNENCPEQLKKKPVVSFIQGSREQLRRCISKLGISSYVDCQNSCDSNSITENKRLIFSASSLFDKMIFEAMRVSATDIHIEENCIRFRINGMLEKYLELEAEKISELIERIKLLAGMNYVDKRKCQNGKFIYGKENPIFIRVSAVPVISKTIENSESVVIRLIGINKEPLKIHDLGFNSCQIKKISELKCLKNGLVLICGPNNSGKATTIASILTEIQTEKDKKLKMITLEDSPKYLLPNVSQIQIDERFINSYEKNIENIFKQDPDIIVIGEIRNEVSAAVALRASLTGHLVFATLHCSSVGESFLRLENFGINRKLLSSVLKGVICQSLENDNQKRILYADIAIPCEKFCEKIKPYYSESLVEQLFVHYTNYSQVLENTLSTFKEIIKKDSHFEKDIEKQNYHKIFIPKNYQRKKKQKKVI